MHHVMYCFTEAYFQDRTFILQSGGWQYDSTGYESVFMPLSNTCSKHDEQARAWNGDLFVYFSGQHLYFALN